MSAGGSERYHDIISAIDAVSGFFKLAVLPELIGKYFSKTFSVPVATDTRREEGNAVSADQPICQCKQDRLSGTVTCGNDSCSIKIFHLDCLKMQVRPTRKWYCPDCRKQRKQERDAKKASNNST